MNPHTPLILSRRRPPSALRATSPVNGGRITLPQTQPNSSPSDREGGRIIISAPSRADGGGGREADGGGAVLNHGQTGFRDERRRDIWEAQI
jgi:hypothetical protein